MVPRSGDLEPLGELETEEPLVFKSSGTSFRRLLSTAARRMPRYFISSRLIVAACLYPLRASFVCLTQSSS